MKTNKKTNESPYKSTYIMSAMMAIIVILSILTVSLGIKCSQTNSELTATQARLEAVITAQLPEIEKFSAKTLDEYYEYIHSDGFTVNYKLVLDPDVEVVLRDGVAHSTNRLAGEFGNIFEIAYIEGNNIFFAICLDETNTAIVSVNIEKISAKNNEAAKGAFVSST